MQKQANLIKGVLALNRFLDRSGNTSHLKRQGSQ